MQNRPRPVTFMQPPPTNSGGGGGGMGNLMISVIISGIVAFGVVKFLGPDSAKIKTELEAAKQSVSASVAPISGQINSVQSSVSSLQSSVSTLNGEISSLKSKMDTLKAADLTTVNADITAMKADIKKLKDDLAAHTASTGSSSGSSSGSGSSSTTSGITVTLDKSQVISTSTDTGNKDITAVIKNTSGSGKSIALLLELRPISPASYTSADVTTYKAKSTLSGFTSETDGTKQTNPDVPTLVTKIFWVCPDFWLDNGSEKSIWLNFNVKTNTVVTWELKVRTL